MKLNKQGAVAVALVVALAATVPALAAGSKKTTLVVDPCRSAPASYPIEARSSEMTMIDLPIDYYLHEEVFFPLGIGEVVGGTTFASLPGYEEEYIFIAAGENLYVHHVRNTEIQGSQVVSDIVLPVNTVNVAQLAGVPGLQLSRVAAGNYRPVEVAPGVVYGQASLYLTGTVGNAGYYVILDQQWLIEGQSPNGTHLYGSGQICTPGSCDVQDILDIEIGTGVVPGITEEGYLSIRQNYNGYIFNMVFRLERGLAETGHSLQTALGDYWSQGDEIVAAGLDSGPASSDFYVGRKSTKTVRNLATGEETCVLLGQPNDVAVWEPGLAGAEPRYLFVATRDDGLPTVEIVPAASCANGGDPIASLALNGFGDAVSLDVWDVDDDELWIVAVTNGGESSFQAIHLKLTRPGGVDTFTTVGTPSVHSYDTKVSVLDGSCPSEVQAFSRKQWIALDWPASCGQREGAILPCPILEPNCLPEDPRCEPPTPLP